MVAKFQGQSNVSDMVAKFQDKASDLPKKVTKKEKKKQTPSKVMKVMKVVKVVAKQSQVQGKPPNTLCSLEYKKNHRLPRHYGSVTIYTNTLGKEWRIKPAPGRRDEKKIKFNHDGNQLYGHGGWVGGCQQ